MTEYTNEDLDRLYNKEYFESTYEKEKSNWMVRVEFIDKKFSPTKILDIGCGEGFSVKAFNEYGIDAYGIEGSSYAISKIDKSIKNKVFQINLNSHKFPFENETFDFILCSHTIEHIHNLDFFVSELSRVLKTGGNAWILTPNRPVDKTNPYDVNMKEFHEWKQFFKSKGFFFRKQWHYGFLGLKGKLRPLRLYNIPEPLLTWLKYFVYWYGKKREKTIPECSFIIIKKDMMTMHII